MTYPRRILLVVSGLSPQVVTETLYALSFKPENAWMPTEIHLITTKEGREIARHSLLNPLHGYFYRLVQDYDLPEIDFSIEKVHVIHDRHGFPLEDIRSEQDNQDCADAIIDIVRQLSSNPQSALHLSMAGGRKTMGYYLGYALSLYGRAQDRLSHVLVNTPYESHPEFYYPTKESQLIHTRGGRVRPYDTKEAQVTLAEIPFVRLRDGLPHNLLYGESGFLQTVNAAQRALEAPELIVDLENRCLSVSGEIIFRITPAQLAFYSWMARRGQLETGPVRYDDPAAADDFLAEYRLIIGEFSSDFSRAEESLKKGMTKEDFEYRKSRVNRLLKEALPPQLFNRYQIASIGKRPNTRYGLCLDATAIRYEILSPAARRDQSAKHPVLRTRKSA